MCSVSRVGHSTPWSPRRGSGGSRNLNTRSTERRTARDGKRRQAIPIPYGALTGRGSGYGRQGLTALRPVIVPLAVIVHELFSVAEEWGLVLPRCATRRRTHWVRSTQLHAPSHRQA